MNSAFSWGCSTSPANRILRLGSSLGDAELGTPLCGARRRAARARASHGPATEKETHDMASDTQKILFYLGLAACCALLRFAVYYAFGQ